MITTLHIKNIGIIDDLSLNLNSGFNVLTGETGAGKTLIIDSLGIICGGRFSKDMIRTGEEFSFVEMSMYLPENEKVADGNVIVSREIYINGRNLCKINGRLVTVSELKEFMNDIIDIHGQNDNQNLLNKEMHIQYLDNFSGKSLLEIKEEYQKLYEKYNSMKFELKNNYGDEKEKQRKLDLLQYQLNEIENAKLKQKEEEDLSQQRKIMLNSEKIAQGLENVDIQIGETALDSINCAIKELEKIENMDEKYQKQLNTLKGIYYDLQEISIDIGEYKSETYFNESERQEVEERLDLIFSLKRKYGNTIEEILEYKKEIQNEIETIENIEEYNEKLRKEILEIEKEMMNLCEKLTIKRITSAQELQNKINSELQDLEMQNAKLHIEVKNNVNKEFNKNGLNRVEFLITTNIGQEEKPLVKIASGGEMSRIMLAIKTVLSNVDEVPILVFDEIDTGISGAVAGAVGEKLSKIANTHQVLIVTHLATIAAKGRYNYYIHKEVTQGKTVTKVDLLNEEQTIKEIARIATGIITDISLKHAQSLRV